MRAVWSGSIGFGLVSIPVRLYPAISAKDPRFHLLDRQTGRRVRNRRVVRETYEPRPPLAEAEPEPAVSEEPPRSEPEEREVASTDLVRGYEVERGRHVLLEEEELEALRPEPTKTIEIEHLVSLKEITPSTSRRATTSLPGRNLPRSPTTCCAAPWKRRARWR